MRFVGLAGLLLGTLTLACSDSETMVAVNVCTLATVDAESISTLRITITGAASASHTAEDPDVRACGTHPSYYARIAVSEADGNATVGVDALDASGSSLAEASSEIEIVAEEVVAAFIELGEEEVPPPAGGAGGEGGAPAEGGAGGDAMGGQGGAS